MKSRHLLFTGIFVLVTTLFSEVVLAQHLVIPRASPKATVSQYIGVCNVVVDYSRPSTKNRKILGGLVPYDKVWRAGANEATTIAFNHALTIKGNNIPAGKYALFMVPGKNKWVVIFNKDAEQWGAYSYRKDDDVVRFEVGQKQGDFTELCTYSFVDVDKTKGVLRLAWENFQVDIPISTDTHDQTVKEIANSTDKAKENWYNFSAAAQYYFYERKEVEKALELIDIAIALKAPNPSPWMLKSQIYAYQENYREAIKYAEEAIVVSKEAKLPHEVEENQEKIKLWKSTFNR